MMKKFSSLFEVNTNDTLGSAFVKGATKGYLQGVVAAGIGLGVLAIGVMALENKVESEEEEEDINERLMKDLEEASAIIAGQKAIADSI